MTTLPERDQVMAMVTEAIGAGARQERACEAISLSERTLQRWHLDRVEGACDRRPARMQMPKNKLDELERRRLLAIANSPEFGHLSPSQIVPRLADQGEYVASESTFYSVLKAENQLRHRGAERPSKPRSKPRALSATAPDELFSWDITVRHEVACRSCSYFSSKEPFMSLDESTVLNQERAGQSNEASLDAGYKS